MGPALRDSVKKLNPRTLVFNPVMFVVEVGSVLTTIMLVKLIADGADAKTVIVNALIIIFLWLTVIFANFAEALAEGRGKAQAATLRKTKVGAQAKRLTDARAAHYARSYRVRAAQGRPRAGRGGRPDPQRRRSARRRGLRQRGGHHRRVGAGAQGAGHRHLVQRHRRHDDHQRLADPRASPPSRGRPSWTA